MMEKEEILLAFGIFFYGAFYVNKAKFPLDFRNSLLYCYDMVLIGV
jgi:hypothetical protein